MTKEIIDRIEGITYLTRANAFAEAASFVLNYNNIEECCKGLMALAKQEKAKADEFVQRANALEGESSSITT